MAAKGWLYDAGSGARHQVVVEAQGHSLVVRREDGTAQSFDPEKLRPVERRRGAEVYALAGVEGWRLGLTELDDRLVEARLPEFDEPPAGAPKRVFLYVLLAVAIAAATLVLFRELI